MTDQSFHTEYSNPIRGLWLELANHLYASYLALDFSEGSHENSASYSDSWSWLMAIYRHFELLQI